MDADVYGPSIPHLVGASGRPMARGDRIQPIETNGLKLMSMVFLLEPDKAVIMRGPMLHGIMQQFLRQRTGCHALSTLMLRYLHLAP